MKYYEVLRLSSPEEVACFIATHIMQFHALLTKQKTVEPEVNDDELWLRLVEAQHQMLIAEAPEDYAKRVLLELL